MISPPNPVYVDPGLGVKSFIAAQKEKEESETSKLRNALLEAQLSQIPEENALRWQKAQGEEIDQRLKMLEYAIKTMPDDPQGIREWAKFNTETKLFQRMPGLGGRSVEDLSDDELKTFRTKWLERTLSTKEQLERQSPGYGLTGEAANYERMGPQKYQEYKRTVEPYKPMTRGAQMADFEEKERIKQSAESGGAFQGKGAEVQYLNTIMKLRPKVASGSATDEELNQYKLAEWQLTQPKIVMDPVTQQQMVMNPTLPQGFPSLLNPNQRTSGKPQTAQEQAQIRLTPINDPAALQKADMKKYRDSLDQISLMRTRLKKLSDMVESKWDRSVPIYTDPGVTREFQTAYNDVLMNYKEVLNLGVLNGPDLEVMNRILQDPTRPATAAFGKDYIKKSYDLVLDNLTVEENYWRKKLGYEPVKNSENANTNLAPETAHLHPKSQLTEADIKKAIKEHGATREQIIKAYLKNIGP